MKRSRPHRVQLSSQALTVWRNASLLSTVPVLVFGKRDNKGQVISENAALQMVKRFDRSLTGHGFRASFKGWARAQRRYEPDAIELALAHRLPPLEEASAGNRREPQGSCGNRSHAGRLGCLGVH